MRRGAVGTSAKVTAIIVAIVVLGAGGYYYSYYLAAPPPQKVTLKVYGSVDTQDMQSVLKDFQGNYSYLTVSYQEFTPPTAFANLTAALAAHNATAEYAFRTTSYIN